MNELRPDYPASLYHLLYADHCSHYLNTIQSLNQVFGDWRPRSVLVAACGTGTDFEAMGRLGWDCSWYGFDLLPEMVEQARQNLAWQGMEATVWTGDLLEPGFGSPESVGKVDLVVLRGNSINHLSPDQQGIALANMYGQLSPGGRLLIDFRDGHRYFTPVPLTEQLGEGYLEREGLHFVSFYCRHASSSTHLPYEVEAMIVGVTGQAEVKVISKSALSGYYAFPEAMEEACQLVGFTGYREVTDVVGQSLRELRTFVAEKG